MTRQARFQAAQSVLWCWTRSTCLSGSILGDLGLSKGQGNLFGLGLFRGRDGVDAAIDDSIGNLEHRGWLEVSPVQAALNADVWG
eukprot:1721921-Prymnesium_polylepis.1